MGKKFAAKWFDFHFETLYEISIFCTSKRKSVVSAEVMSLTGWGSITFIILVRIQFS